MWKLILGVFLLVGGIGIVDIGVVLLGIVLIFWYLAKKKQRESSEQDKHQEVKQDDCSESTQSQHPEQIKEPRNNSKSKGSTYKRNPTNIEQNLEAYSYSGIKAAGVSYAQPDFASLKLGSAADLIFEPDNPHDSKAVRVEQNGMVLGHIHRGVQLDMIHDYTKKNWPIRVMPIEFNEEKQEIRLHLSFYQPVEEIDAREAFSSRLVGMSKRDFFGNPKSDNIYGLEPGDLVLLEKDYETGRIAASSHTGEIGELSAAAAEKINMDSARVPYAAIQAIDETEDGKYKVTLKVMP